jgi:hypothetical protein
MKKTIREHVDSMGVVGHTIPEGVIQLLELLQAEVDYIENAENLSDDPNRQAATQLEKKSPFHKSA